MKKTVFSISLLGILVFLFIGCQQTTFSKKTYTSEDLGLRKTNLLDEQDITLAGFEYISTPAGESKLIERSYENAPPLISHDVEGQMEITQDLNMCTSCHLPELAEAQNATAMPKSHFISMISHKDLGDTMDEARYNCVSCHVPQAQGLAPLVKNNFDPNFRDKGSEFKSTLNLLDTLNEEVQ